MAGEFWNSWELWQKMCFVLGVAIVIVVLLGIAKLVHDRLKLRKFTKVASAQGDEAPPMQQRQRRGRADSDVPFGVRALESGIEVEGVWISRPTSPNRSLEGSPRSSTPTAGFISGKGKAPERGPAVALPRAVHSSSGARSDSSKSSDFDRAVDAERLPSNRSSRTVSPNGSHRVPQRSYKPRQSSALRYSHFHNEEEEEAESSGSSQPNRSPSGSSTDSRESLRASQASPNHYRPKRPSRQTSYSGYGGHPVPFVQPRRSEVDLMPFQSQSGVDLSYLSPRRSMAAEAGLLLNKSRLSSADNSPRSTPQPSIVEEEEGQTQTSPNHKGSNPFATPSRTPEPLVEIDVQPFSNIVASDPKLVSSWPLGSTPLSTQTESREGKRARQNS